MKKGILTITLCGITFMSACQAGNDEAAQGIYHENGNTINVTERNEGYNEARGYNGDNKSKDNFGYVRHQKSPVEGLGREFDGPAIDREKLADSISRLLITLPNVNDAATLVTDEEVLVAYASNGESRFETADQVKKTAISIAPRYYHVYISDDPNMFREIERFGQMNTDTRQAHDALNQTIKNMLNSPQGRKLSDGENENGESIGEMNDHIDDDMNNKSKNELDFTHY